MSEYTIGRAEAYPTNQAIPTTSIPTPTNNEPISRLLGRAGDRLCDAETTLRIILQYLTGEEKKDTFRPEYKSLTICAKFIDDKAYTVSDIAEEIMKQIFGEEGVNNR